MPTIAVVVILLALFTAVLASAARGSPPVITVPPLFVPLDNVKLIKMIRLEENWDGRSEGKQGERGPSQIKLITWRQHTNVSFEHARYRTPLDVMEYREVEVAHAAWIRDRMESARYPMPQTAYTFALIWRAGHKAVINGRATKEERAYAERASNIYKELTK